jgi:hypothetical protein
MSTVITDVGRDRPMSVATPHAPGQIPDSAWDDSFEAYLVILAAAGLSLRFVPETISPRQRPALCLFSLARIATALASDQAVSQ